VRRGLRLVPISHLFFGMLFSGGGMLVGLIAMLVRSIGMLLRFVVLINVMGFGANGRIWPAIMSAELPEGWAWAS
jgi:hypothetical protein